MSTTVLSGSGRQQPPVTENTPQTRAARQACRRVGRDGESVAVVAADFGVGWGTVMRAVAEHGGIETVCAEIGVPAALAAQIGPRVLAKLEREPIEDLRIDFEDGYGTRGDDAEDAK